MGGSLPFRSGVVVSLRPLSVCHGPMWLVPALFPSLSLSFPVCAHLLLGRDFLLLPDCPSPYFGLLVYWFLWLLFSTRVNYLRNGVTPLGSWTDCPRSERRFSLSIWVRYAGQFLAGHSASICTFRPPPGFPPLPLHLVFDPLPLPVLLRFTLTLLSLFLPPVVFFGSSSCLSLLFGSLTCIYFLIFFLFPFSPLLLWFSFPL